MSSRLFASLFVVVVVVFLLVGQNANAKVTPQEHQCIQSAISSELNGLGIISGINPSVIPQVAQHDIANVTTEVENCIK